MKFCPQCGKQLDDNMKFCGGCGASVDSAPAPAQPEPQQFGQQQFPQQQFGQPQPPFVQQQINNFQNDPAAPKKPNPVIAKIKANPKIPIIAGAAVVAVTVLTIVIVNITKYQKIDAAELFKVEFEGLNNYGTAVPSFKAYPDYYYETMDSTNKLNELFGYEEESNGDEDEEEISPYFSTDTDTFMKAWSKAKNQNEASKMRNALLKKNSNGNYLLKCTVENGENLKNGDVVKCKVEYDEDYLKGYKIKLTNTEFEAEVKNLDDGIELDPFDEKYLKIDFSGIDGRGRLEYDASGSLDFVGYDYDKYSNLSNGDKVTMSAYFYYDTKKAGDVWYIEYDSKYYIVKDKDPKKEYEVKGLTELKELDPFEGIEFEYTRGTPFLKIDNIVKDKMDKELQDNVYYRLEKAEGLKVGDKFTVRANAYSGLEDDGYKLKGKTDSEGYYVKEFTVDDKMPKYVTASEGKTAYDSFTTVEDQITQVRKNVVGSKYLTGLTLNGKAESIESFKLASVYVAFNTKTSSDSIDWWWSEYVNRVMGVYEVKVKTDDPATGADTFIAVIFADNITVTDSKYSTPDLKTKYYANMDDFKKEMVDIEGYTVSKAGGDKKKEDKKDDESKEDKKAEESKAEESKTEESKAEESKAEESKAEESEAEKSDGDKDDKKDDKKDEEKTESKSEE